MFFAGILPVQNKEKLKMATLLIENEEVKETANNLFETVQKNTRKVWLASLGLVGLGFDQVNKIATRSQEILADAEKRGVEVEDIAAERVSELQTQIRTRLNRVEKRVETVRENVQSRVKSAMPQAVVAVEPVAGYSDMTAKEIIAMLSDLTEAQLVEIKHFEMAHDNRVTVLREVARLLETEEETA
jgi:ElaB/YqjD/DUF883 family membrane-anchored ribosome-binding protein